MAREPYQYKLRLRVPTPPKPPVKNLPHLVFYEGKWHLFRNRYKSQYRGTPHYAATVSGVAIADITKQLHKPWVHGFGRPPGYDYSKPRW